MDSVKTIDTPYNNAVLVLNKTNQLLLENNIKDSTGEDGYHALITWLSCTDHVADHAMIT